MNQLTFAKSPVGQGARSWQASTRNPQHASPRSLTTSHHRTIRLEVREKETKEKGKEKEREVATVVESLGTP